MAASITLDEACFIGNEAFIKDHAPFDFSQSLLVHPVRIAMATVGSIVHHNSFDWFEGAVKLLEFIHSRHEDIECELYCTIINRIKKSIVLYEMSSDPTISKEQSMKSIEKYFPSDDDPNKQALIELFSQYKYKPHKIIEITLQEFSDTLINDIEKYFQVIEDRELPIPLTTDECYSYNPAAAKDLETIVVLDSSYEADCESEESDGSDDDINSQPDYSVDTDEAGNSTEY